MTKAQESKARQERVMNCIIEGAREKRKIVEEYIKDNYIGYDIIERQTRDRIEKYMGSKIIMIPTGTGKDLRVIVATRKHTKDTEKIVWDFI